MKRPALAALCVVIKDDLVLLVRRKAEPDAGLWGFPGGHVEWGETVGAAACRELMEETTVTATPGKMLTGLDVIVSADGIVAHHFHLVAVLCHYVAGHPEGRDDVHEAAWVPQAEVLQGRLRMSDRVDDVLRLALQ